MAYPIHADLVLELYRVPHFVNSIIRCGRRALEGP